MRYRMLKLTAGFLALGAIAVFQTGCDMTEAGSAFEDLDVILQLQPVETFVIGQVLDASTGELVTTDVQVSFEGQDAGALVDAYSDPVTQLKSTSGYVSFGLRNAVVPTSTSPVVVRVRASAAGYNANRTTLRLNAQGNHSFKLYLERADEAPAGAQTATNESTQTGSDGTLSAGISLQTDPNVNTGAAASLAIPDGTVLRNADGHPLSGSVSARLVYYDTDSEEALRAFPGGFTSALVRDEHGNSSTSFVAAAGFAALNVTVGGEAVAETSNPISLQMGLPAGAVNPLTGNPYQAGDTVDLYTYDEATGTWTFLQQANLQSGAGKNGSSDLFAKLQLQGRFGDDSPELESEWSRPHVTAILSRLIDLDGSSDPAIYTIKDVSDTWGDEWYSASNLTLKGSNGAGWITNDIPFTSVMELIQTMLTIEIPNIPNLSGYLNLSLPDGTYFETLLPSLSRGELVLPDPAGPLTDVTFSVSMPCTLNMTAPLPGFGFTYKLTGFPGGGALVPKPVWHTVSDTDQRITGGSITVPSLAVGATYSLSFVFTHPDPVIGTLDEQHDVTITGPEMSYAIQGHDMPSELCAASE